MTLSAMALSIIVTAAFAAENEVAGLPLVFEDDFEHGAEHWAPTDANAWKIQKTEKGGVFSQHEKRSKYEPPFRSPYNLALLKDINLSDVVVEARVRSTHPDYGHRDVCIAFGYQDPAHFYYVHLGKQADEHANQIFIVNQAPRTKISITSTEGTNWDDEWHTVRVIRRVADGTIEVFFDDMNKPVMTAKDETFQWGRIGIGTFDDTSDWDHVKVYGKKIEKP
jgi:hypothetical protein